MFDFFKKSKAIVNNKAKTADESNAIAAPRKSIAKFIPIDVVIPNQTMPGKFNYSSSTWKYLANYFSARQEKLHQRNENPTLGIEKTQLIRGQLKEIKLLLNHINQLAGINPPPTKSTLDQSSTVRGNNYE